MCVGMNTHTHTHTHTQHTKVYMYLGKIWCLPKFIPLRMTHMKN